MSSLRSAAQITRKTAPPRNRSEVGRQAAQHPVLPLDTLARHVADLSDERWKLLRSCRSDYRKHMSAGDEESAAFVIGTIAELLTPPEFVQWIPYEQWVAEQRTDPQARARGEEFLREQADFHRNYMRFKSAAGLDTQRAVAEAAGVSVTTVNMIETGHAKPHFRTIQKIARAFGVATEDLLAGAAQRPRRAERART